MSSKMKTNFKKSVLCIFTYKENLINDLIWFIVLNATFSNISAISWQPVLVVKEADVFDWIWLLINKTSNLIKFSLQVNMPSNLIKFSLQVNMHSNLIKLS
jgi:hypothetical protein